MDTLDILGADLRPDGRAICRINASGQITIPSAIRSQFDSSGYACFIDDEGAGIHLYPSDYSHRPDRDPRVDRVTVRPVDSAPIEVEPPRVHQFTAPIVDGSRLTVPKPVRAQVDADVFELFVDDEGVMIHLHPLNVEKYEDAAEDDETERNRLREYKRIERS